MDLKIFFNEVRDHVFGKTMYQAQVDGCVAILDAWGKHAPASDPRFIAYSLATAFHETARSMAPVRELGAGRGRAYGHPVAPYNQIYYGRGYVQLTWERNYAIATRALLKHNVVDRNIDLVRYPDLAMRPDIAAGVLVFGMLEGWFTGRKLVDYFAGTRSDWVDARVIINGHDRAALIAGYGLAFYHALSEANRRQ
jgi:putative chitinase